MLTLGSDAKGLQDQAIQSGSAKRCIVSVHPPPKPNGNDELVGEGADKQELATLPMSKNDKSEKPQGKMRRKNSVSFSTGKGGLMGLDKVVRNKMKFPVSPSGDSMDGDMLPKTELDTVRCLLHVMADAKEFLLGGGELSWSDTEQLGLIIRSMNSALQLKPGDLKLFLHTQKEPLTHDSLFAVIQELRVHESFDLQDISTSVIDDSQGLGHLSYAIATQQLTDTEKDSKFIKSLPSSGARLGRRSSIAPTTRRRQFWLGKGLQWPSAHDNVLPEFTEHTAKLCKSVLDQERLAKDLKDDLTTIQKRLLKNRAKLGASINQVKDYVGLLQHDVDQFVTKMGRLEAASEEFRELQRADFGNYAELALGDRELQRVKRRCQKEDDELRYVESCGGPYIAKMKEIDEQIQAHQAYFKKKNELEQNLASAQEVNGLLHEVLQRTMENRVKAGTIPALERLCEYNSAVQGILGTL